MTITHTAQESEQLAGIGLLIKQWRQQRRLSQMHLALEVGISPRHLSFIETGRSRPSVEVLLALATALAVPLRTRNSWLLAAGYAPRFTEQTLSSERMTQVRAALDKLLLAHDPYPGVVLDGHWDVVLANRSAQRLMAQLPAALRQPAVNMFRASLHPEGFAALTQNFAEWGNYLWHELQKLVAQSRDPRTLALATEIAQYPNVKALRTQAAPMEAPQLLIPCVLALGGQSYSLFTTLTSFGTPRDITLAELSVELFYPADAATEVQLHQLAAA